MDSAEAHAEKFLLAQGLGPVQHEPDGNQPPDFVTADGTAVEVRRLNKHYDGRGQQVALEYDEFPLLTGMRRLLASFGPSQNGRSWWVGYHFHRPVPLWKELEPKVRAALKEVTSTECAPTEPLLVDTNFKLHVIPCESPQEERFLLSGYADYDSGGWLLYELQRNIQICVDEKRRKIAPHRQRYPRWWLILVDGIGHGLGAREAEMFKDSTRITHDWDRVVLLSPRDPTSWVDVRSEVAAP